MNILVTNDDGITSEGLTLLVQALHDQTKHIVYVIAPDTNRSAVSHSINFMRGPIRLKPAGENKWACSGTPADCVVIALMEAVSPVPDLVLSGINQGPNLGTDIIYSGTAAGARQAVLHGVPGIALSLDGLKPFFWDKTVRFAVEHLDEFVCSWQSDTFVNVNFPNTPDGPVGTALTFPSHRIYHDTLDVYDASDGKKYCFVQGGDVETVYEDKSDWDAVSRNLVSVCPVYVHPTGIK